MIYLAIFMGGGLGALLRFLLSHLHVNRVFPWGTIVANVVGAFGIGFVFIWFAKEGSSPWRLFWAVGFLGALTTFSTFSYEAIGFLKMAQWRLFIVHFLAHNLLSLGACFLGGALCAVLFSR